MCCPENLDENPLWPARSAREAFCPISHKVEAPFVHKLDHQLLSCEADSDEVQLFTVGGVSEDDLFLPTFVKVGEFGLKDARGPQRKCWWPQTRPGPSPRFSCRCTCCEERTSTKSSAPMRDGCPRLRINRIVSTQCSLSPRREASKLRSRERMHACRSCARRCLR